jgi:hypothetical protein
MILFCLIFIQSILYRGWDGVPCTAKTNRTVFILG